MIKSITDFDVKDKRVLVRCDFNVPLNRDGTILDDFRIKKTLPTIQYLISKEAKIILMSHLDPENTGLVDPKFTLKSVAERVSLLLKLPVIMAENYVGGKVIQQVEQLKSGEILLLENVRFHKGEVNNTEAFAKKLSDLGDIFINEAFAECHRPYASIVSIPKFLPHGAGFLLEKEIENLNKVLKNPQRPLVAVVGGAKVTTKVVFLKKISEIADWVIINGLLQEEIMKEKIEFKNSEKIIGPDKNLRALDVSEEAIKVFRKKISTAKTIVWNGPFGKIEDKKFRKGTLKIAQAIIASSAFSVAGGGKTIEFLDQENLISKFNHVSTGGGAMLAYLTGDVLPGIKALRPTA